MNLRRIEMSQQADFEKNAWAQLINSVSGFKSANLIGTRSESGLENLAIISSVFHLGATPPLLGFILRPHSEDSPRHTFLNLKENGWLTLNHVNEKIYERAHQTSARYPREASEFEACQLTAEYKDGFYAPFVKEASLQISAKLDEAHLIKQNQTNLMVVQIECIYLPEEALQPDGYIDLEGAGTICLSGLDSYHSTTRLRRLSYAKPDREPKELKLDGKPLDTSR